MSASDIDQEVDEDFDTDEFKRELIEFNGYLQTFDFDAAKKFMLSKSEYAIDEWFEVEDMMEVLFKIRNTFCADECIGGIEQLLHEFYQAFVDGGQEDFFTYIDQFAPDDVSTEEAEMLDDLYPFMPDGMKWIFNNVVTPTTFKQFGRR